MICWALLFMPMDLGGSEAAIDHKSPSDRFDVAIGTAFALRGRHAKALLLTAAQPT
jgi:hypothetical protein